MKCSKLFNIKYVEENLRDSKLENVLAKELRKCSGEDAQNFIVGLLKNEKLSVRKGALSLIKRLELDKCFIECILKLALKRKDVSEIQIWLNSIYPRFGIKNILKLLKEHDNVEEILLCFYQLYILLHQLGRDAKLELDAIFRLVDLNQSKLSEVDKAYWKQTKKYFDYEDRI